MMRSKRELRRGPGDAKLSARFWLLVVFLTLTAAFGGSARGDVSSLFLLRPIAVLVAGIGLWSLKREQIRANWFLFAMLAAASAMAALHLVPLPFGVWSALPGREIIVEIDRVAGLSSEWRPLTLSPAGTRNALFSLVVPLAVLVLAVQLSPQELRRLLPVFVLMGLLSAVLASLQILGPPGGPLYLYSVTNEGAAVGLFANRNHQAVLLSCLLMMLGLYAAGAPPMSSEGRRRMTGALVASIFLLPLILLTGSRGGLIFGAVGLVAGWFIYRLKCGPSKSGARLRPRILIGVGVGLAVVVPLIWWTISSGRAESITRLLELESEQDIRRGVWGVAVEAIGQFLPMGSGVGSYERVFRISEPAELLRSSYSNHAHNDWLEVIMTAGLPGALLLLVALGAFVLQLRRLVVATRAKRDVAWNWLGCMIILIVGLSSIVDYPLRVPLMASFFVIACLWVRLRVTPTPESGLPAGSGPRQF